MSEWHLFLKKKNTLSFTLITVKQRRFNQKIPLELIKFDYLNVSTKINLIRKFLLYYRKTAIKRFIKNEIFLVYIFGHLDEQHWKVVLCTETPPIHWPAIFKLPHTVRLKVERAWCICIIDSFHIRMTFGGHLKRGVPVHWLPY